MSQVMLAYFLGGWSDAVHWDAMEPRIRITPLGDVHVDQSFMKRVYEPFGRVFGEADVRQAAESYAELYAPVELRRSVADVLGFQFLCAWEAEFGAPLDGVRAFIDELEEIARHPPNLILELPRSALAAMLAAAADISSENASAAVNMLTLMPRPAWRVVTGEFKEKDWYPWRFRRCLSILRRPFIQLDSGDDPVIAFAPGLVREAFHATVVWFHIGEIPAAQARSPEMRKWIGHANNVQRGEFNATVADRMRELGWQVESEVKLTKILGRPLERDYGDIDVFAWRRDSGRVLVMECKDVQFNKAIGEVAEQLADFRGQMRSDGKPDRLKRHLSRLEVLTANEVAISRVLQLALPVRMEGHLVFRNPVPMRFAWDHMARQVQLSIFDELHRI
jgi:hypothetical protein